MIERIDYMDVNPKAMNAFLAVKKHAASIDARLRTLIELRVSQINGCTFCVALHADEARAEGETQQRLDCLVVWKEYPFFDPRERAALAWAEAITTVGESHAPDDLYDGLKEHFSELQIVDLTLIISLMNALNRIAIGFRHLPDAQS